MTCSYDVLAQLRLADLSHGSARPMPPALLDLACNCLAVHVMCKREASIHHSKTRNDHAAEPIEYLQMISHPAAFFNIWSCEKQMTLLVREQLEGERNESAHGPYVSRFRDVEFPGRAPFVE
jgi:hypothetical protein